MQSGIQGKAAVLLCVLMVGACISLGQEPPTVGSASTDQATPPLAYKPKFGGDPARSDSEAGALGYLRTVLTAQRLYKKKHNSFATSLPGLVHTGSFTQRMTKTDRGDYFVSFHAQGKGTGFGLGLTPKAYDSTHRAFYGDETGVIRVEEDKEAAENSPRLK